MQVNIFLAFGAGVLSFLSPCVLPLIPAYIALITGLTTKELEEEEEKYFSQLFSQSILFILGFSFVFISFSITINYFGKYIPQGVLRIIGGSIVILLGLHMVGIITINFLNKVKKINLSKKPLYIGSAFVVGMVFAFGWSPCIGPILGSILMYASVQETLSKSIFLLISYCLGLGIPFIFISVVGVGMFVKFFKKFNKYYRVVEIASGVLLIIIGLLILLNKFWIK